MATASGLANNLGGQVDTKRDEIKVTAASLLSETPFDNIPIVLKNTLAELEAQLVGIGEQLGEQEKRMDRKKELDEAICRPSQSEVQ